MHASVRTIKRRLPPSDTKAETKGKWQTGSKLSCGKERTVDVRGPNFL